MGIQDWINIVLARAQDRGACPWSSDVTRREFSHLPFVSLTAAHDILCGSQNIPGGGRL